MHVIPLFHANCLSLNLLSVMLFYLIFAIFSLFGNEISKKSESHGQTIICYTKKNIGLHYSRMW